MKSKLNKLYLFYGPLSSNKMTLKMSNAKKNFNLKRTLKN